MKKKRPFWDYHLEEVLTPELSREIAYDLFRAWTGEEPPSLRGKNAKRDKSAKRDNDKAAVA